MAKTRFGLEAHLSLIERFSPSVIAAELIPARVGRPRDDLLVLGCRDGALEFFPWRMRAIAETSRALDRPSFETLRAPSHTQRLLRLRLVLGWRHHPVLVLFLLFGQDLDIPSGHAGCLGGLAKLFHIAVSESKRFLSTYYKKKND